VTSDRLPRILVVDDEHFIRDLLCDFFSKCEYSVVTAPDGESGIAECRASRFDAALVDLKMPDQTGTDVLAELRSIDPTLPVIIMTGYPTIDASIEAIRRGAHDFVVKPFRLQDLKERVDRAIRTRSIARDIDELRARMASIEDELREYRSRQTLAR
jgi:DNA-binding NtrC family response regulator